MQTEHSEYIESFSAYLVRVVYRDELDDVLEQIELLGDVPDVWGVIATHRREGLFVLAVQQPEVRDALLTNLVARFAVAEGGRVLIVSGLHEPYAVFESIVRLEYARNPREALRLAHDARDLQVEVIPLAHQTSAGLRAAIEQVDPASLGAIIVEDLAPWYPAGFPWAKEQELGPEGAEGIGACLRTLSRAYGIPVFALVPMRPPASDDREEWLRSLARTTRLDMHADEIVAVPSTLGVPLCRMLMQGDEVTYLLHRDRAGQVSSVTAVGGA